MGKRSRKRHAGALTTEQRAIRALRELEGLGAALLRDLGVSSRAPLPVDELVVPVSVRLDTSKPPGDSASSLVAVLQERIEGALGSMVAFRPGHVYCFLCDEPACEHSQPSDAADTFVGYTAHGRPEWQGLANVCLARGDDRVDRLYGRSPEILVIASTAEELTGELMPGFGRESLSYRVLGQVVAGLVPEDFELDGSDATRRALTLQLVETMAGHEGRRLRLNFLGISRDALVEQAAEGHAKGPAESLRRVIGATRQRLGALSKRLADAERDGQPLDVIAEIDPLLTRLRSDVARALRPVRHRTQHARVRHEEGDRPTSTALSDARGAPDHALLRDVRRDTVVVIGPKARAHVFSDEGKHVTSLVLSPGEVEKKTGRSRWRKMSRSEIAAFRGKL